MQVKLLKSSWFRKAIRSIGSVIEIEEKKAQAMIAAGRAELHDVVSKAEAAVIANPLAIVLGLNETTIKDLEKRGIATLEDLAVASVSDLKGLSGVKANVIKGLITKAAEVIAPIVTSNE